MDEMPFRERLNRFFASPILLPRKGILVLRRAQPPAGRLSRPGARCRDFSRSVSPDRSPNPACDSHRTGLSTVPAVVTWLGRVQGLGIVLPRHRYLTVWPIASGWLVRVALASRAIESGVVYSVPLLETSLVRLKIAAIGVDSALMGLGLGADGSMNVPPGGFPAGWYTGGRTPGELGPAIIAGHVDMKGPGVFFNLHNVKPGDQVTVARADGSKPVFRVTRIAQLRRTSSPPSWYMETSTMPDCG